MAVQTSAAKDIIQCNYEQKAESILAGSHHRNSADGYGRHRDTGHSLTRGDHLFRTSLVKDELLEMSTTYRHCVHVLPLEENFPIPLTKAKFSPSLFPATQCMR